VTSTPVFRQHAAHVLVVAEQVRERRLAFEYKHRPVHETHDSAAARVQVVADAR